jgi:hypothetical protein
MTVLSKCVTKLCVKNVCNKVVCDDKEVSGRRSGQERTTEKQEPNAKTWGKSLCFAPRHLPPKQVPDNIHTAIPPR